MRLATMTAEETVMFGYLPVKPNDQAACGKDDKITRLLLLASEGW